MSCHQIEGLEGLGSASGGTEGPGAFGTSGKRAGTREKVSGERTRVGVRDLVGERERRRGLPGSDLLGDPLGEPGTVVPENGEEGAEITDIG